MIKVYALDPNDRSTYDNGKETTTFSFVYFHGNLDDDLGYDIVLIEVDDLNTITKDGIYDVNVIKTNGDTVEAKLYFWIAEKLANIATGETMKFNRGLIVYADDTEAIEYAKNKFESKCQWL